MIPSLAIHMNRDANNGVNFNPQKDLLPLYGDENAKGTFMERMAVLAGVARKDILAHDLYVYSRTPGTIWVLQENIFPAVVWTICSVHSRHWKVSCRHRTEKVFRFTVSLTMKKWEVPASRGCFYIASRYVDPHL